MKLFVIDVGGTEIKYCTMDDSLNTENAGYIPTPKDSMETFLNTIEKIYLPYKNETEGIAVSLPGFVDTQNGTQNGGGALGYMINTPVGSLISQKCGCKVHLENDGKAAAVAEMKEGNLKDVTNGAVFILGTAVGGGLIINKDILRGSHFTAGEFSFIVADDSNWETTESTTANRCSTTALLRFYKNLSGNQDDIDGREFFRRLPNDSYAQQALKQLCKNIAIQIYNLGMMLDIEKVAIGGGISRQPILLETIHNEIEILKQTYPLKKYNLEAMFPEVVPCKFLSNANMVGAYLSYKFNL